MDERKSVGLRWVEFLGSRGGVLRSHCTECRTLLGEGSFGLIVEWGEEEFFSAETSTCKCGTDWRMVRLFTTKEGAIDHGNELGDTISELDDIGTLELIPVEMLTVEAASVH